MAPTAPAATLRLARSLQPTTSLLCLRQGLWCRLHHTRLPLLCCARRHVRQLRLALPQPRSPRSLTQLRLVSSRLQHLQLNSATWLQQLDWLLLAPPPAPPAQAAPTAAGATGGMAQPVQPPPLTCLILRDCAALQPQALTPLSHLAPTLRLLDLSGAAALDDGAAGVLACLRHLEASLCEAPQAHLGVREMMGSTRGCTRYSGCRRVHTAVCVCMCVYVCVC